MMIKTHLWFFAYTVFVFWYYYAILCYIMLHYSIIVLIVYMHIIYRYIIHTYCMWHDVYAGQVLLLCHAACWILLRSAGTAWATLPVSRWTASQWVQGYAEFVRAITCHHVPSRAMTCHHVPWRAMEPWCDEICWLSSPHCQVHKVIPGRWLFEVHSMQKRNGWKEMEHAATPSHLLKSYPPFLEKSIKSMNRIARVYSNRTNMAQIASPC